MHITDLLLTAAVPLTTVVIMSFTVWAERWLRDEEIDAVPNQAG